MATGSLRAPPPKTYVFYLACGRVWGSDGVAHVPINPALLCYFSPLFTAAQETKSRGSLTFILAARETNRYALLTDNQNFRVSLILFPAAVSFAARNNFPTHAS
jgi:hypothetical protein